MRRLPFSTHTTIPGRHPRHAAYASARRLPRPARAAARLSALLLLLLVPALASAAPPKIFLNGVDITGLTDQTFEGATVKLDSQGNVLIDAPKYKVEVQDSASPNTQAANTTTAAAVSGTYYLVADNSAPGKVQYELDIYVNAILVRTIKDTPGQVVLDITDKLKAGSNTVTVKARKNMLPSRQSAASADAITLLIGRGTSAGNQLTIERQFVSYKVDASQTDDKSQDFTFEVK